MISYKWTIKDWENFYKQTLEGFKEQKQFQVVEDLEEWKKKAHKFFIKRHVRRIIEF